MLPHLPNNRYESKDVEVSRGGVRRTVYGATTVLTDRNNTLESDEIEVFSGGIRQTVFGSTALLTKFPLVFLDGRVRSMDNSAHWVDNATIADFTCVLFHYKFLDGHFRKQAAQAVEEGLYGGRNSTFYKKYLEVLNRNPTLQVKRKSARALESVNDLLEDGFLVVSEEYVMLVHEEERKRHAGHALRGELGGGELGGPRDETAFHRARAQAKVQSLRARRLERHIEDLEKQHRREVEKLGSKLAKARKKNRNLRRFRRQLRSIKASRSWLLLNKLGRLRARITGRKR